MMAILSKKNEEIFWSVGLEQLVIFVIIFVTIFIIFITTITIKSLYLVWNWDAWSVANVHRWPVIFNWKLKLEFNILQFSLDIFSLFKSLYIQLKFANALSWPIIFHCYLDTFWFANWKFQGTKIIYFLNKPCPDLGSQSVKRITDFCEITPPCIYLILIQNYSE